MTTDKLTAALMALFETNKPHESITVRDARSFSDVALPEIVVECEKPDIHSAALVGVNKTPVNIILRAHAGDSESRATLTTWARTIEFLIERPEILRDYITASGQGIRCDYVQFPSGGTGWDDKIFEATFSGEAWVVRTA
jgi:hypothetical protein